MRAYIERVGKAVLKECVVEFPTYSLPLLRQLFTQLVKEGLITKLSNGSYRLLSPTVSDEHIAESSFAFNSAIVALFDRPTCGGITTTTLEKACSFPKALATAVLKRLEAIGMVTAHAKSGVQGRAVIKTDTTMRRLQEARNFLKEKHKVNPWTALVMLSVKNSYGPHLVQ